MMPMEIAPGIYDVGATDWIVRDFHGYKTERGASYNSYLIVDEKICLVDTVKACYAEELLEKIRRVADPAKIDYVVVNHVEPDHAGALPEVLKAAPNAKFVITRRLHVTLPCLALETPVLSIVDLKDAEGNGTRWGCYMDTVRCIDNEDFLSGNFEYDFNNPPENKKGYLALREKLIQDVQDFVAEYENCDLPLEQVRKTTYTPLERLEWQNNMKTEVLEKWLKKSRKLLDDKKLFEKKYKDTLKNLRKYKKYVDELQSQGIISEIKLPDVEDTPKSEQQLQRDAFKNKIWKKIKKMF